MSLRTVGSGLQLGLRASLAAGTSLALANLLSLDYPIYALVAAVLVTDFAPAQTSKLGWKRIVATVVGAFCGALLRTFLPSSAGAIGIGIFVAMSACALLRIQDGSKVAGYISGIVMLDHGSQPWTYALYRLIETALGIAVAWLISFVPRLIRFEEPSNPDAANPAQ